MSDFRKYINLIEAKAKPEQLVLEKLPYKTSALAPILSKKNVEYHYDVLSAAYVRRYNEREGDPIFNYGGTMLHNMFWQQLQAPQSANNPTGAIKEFIEKHFKSFDTFKEELVKTAMTIQGSGWVYLSKSGLLKITPNQSYKTDILMPVDMWEHSFTDYIPAKDAKKKYLFGILKIINWSVISDRLNTK